MVRRSLSTSARATGFARRELRLDGQRHPYQVWVPPGWADRRRRPVILFLHGAGERGTDGVVPTQVGLGPRLKEEPDRYPALVVFPQCRPGRWWVKADALAVATAALRESIEAFEGDPARVSLTGISMGGYGAFELAARTAEPFVAVAPVCGGVPRPRPSDPQAPLADLERTAPDYLEAARRSARSPLWLFHGAEDRVVPVEESRTAAAVLRRLDPSVRYTEYPGVGHDSWDAAYAEPDLPAWLLPD